MQNQTENNIKFILKFNISSSSKVLNPKINTVLSQRRINSNDVLTIFKEKLNLLQIKEDMDIVLKVCVFVFELDNFIIHIKMPSLSTLINHYFYLKKNFNCPGYIFNKVTKKNKYFNYILTPYILYEIVKYQLDYDNIQEVYLSSHFKKSVSALKSKGINLFLCYSKEELLKIKSKRSKKC